MGNKVHNNVAKAAMDVINRILKGQAKGSTLDKWKRDTFKELLKNVNNLPQDQRLQRIISRLRNMIEKDEQWEKNAQEYKVNQNKQSEEVEINTDEKDAKVARALSSAMFNGIMADNRTLHLIRRELLEDLENLEKGGRSYKTIIKHIKMVLLR